mgnify:CR=1 FL=1
MQEGNYKLVYIAGYGRSGSTLLDVILGMHPEIECNGELSYLFNIADDYQERCDCGLELKECPKWKHVFRQLQDQGLERGKEAERIMRSVEHVQNIWTWLFWPIVGLGRWGAYCQLMRGLFDAIYAAQNKPLLVIQMRKEAFGWISSNEYEPRIIKHGIDLFVSFEENSTRRRL